jgi:hypothetical protein
MRRVRNAGRLLSALESFVPLNVKSLSLDARLASFIKFVRLFLKIAMCCPTLADQTYLTSFYKYANKYVGRCRNGFLNLVEKMHRHEFKATSEFIASITTTLIA